MAIAYVNGNTGGNGTGTDVTVTKPSGVVDGDILVAVTYREGGAWTLPSGWAWWGSEQASNAGTSWVGMAWKRASSEGASYVFQLSASTWRIVTMGAWSGCLESGDPGDVYAPYTTTGTVVKAGSITTVTANTMLVVGAGCISGNDVGVASSGYTQRAQLGGCELFEKAQATTTTTGVVIFGDVAGLSGEWATQHVALKPATGATGINGTVTQTLGAAAITATGTVPPSVQYIASATNSNTAATTSCVLNKPSGVQTGDVLVAGLIIEVASPTVTPPADWTLIQSGTPSGTSRALRLLTYYHVVTDADSGTSNWTWTVTTGYEWAGFISAYRRASIPTPSAISTTNTSVTGAVAPTVTTARSWAAVLYVACSAYGTTWTKPSSPGTYNERVDVRSGTGTANVSITQGDQIYSAAGATGTATVTAAAADYWVAAHIVMELQLYGDVTQTLDGATVTATGTVADGAAEISGALAGTLGAATVAATGTVAVTSALSATLGAVAATAAGTVGISGALARTLGAATVAGVGTVAIAGAAAQTLAAAAIVGTGTVSVSGALAGTLATGVLSAAGTVAISGALAQTLAAAAVAAAGVVGNAPAEGTLAQTLAAAAISSAGTVAVAGLAAAQLGATTLAATGTVAVVGATAAQLAAATLAATAATGFVPALGTLDATLSPATLASSATVAVVGTASVALANVALQSAATVAVVGALTRTLSAVALDAQAVAGFAPVVGALEQTLGAAIVASSGAITVQGRTNTPLGAATVYAQGAVALNGVVTVALGMATLTAHGVVVLVTAVIAGRVGGARAHGSIQWPGSATGVHGSGDSGTISGSGDTGGVWH